MSYKTNKKTKTKIDRLLGKNAIYQSENVCVTNSKTKRQEINRYCRVNFINPIKEIDLDFYNQIILA
jgi:spore coat protein CotF